MIKENIKFAIEQSYGLAIAVGTGVIVAVVGYFLNRRSAKRDAEERDKRQLLNTGRSILVEVETNLKLAEQPFQNRLVPFVTSMWEAHKGMVIRLPKDLQDTLYQVYVEIQLANALVQSNLSLPYGKGYYNEDYKKKCSEITENAGKASELLSSWLRQEGVKELPNAKRQSS